MKKLLIPVIVAVLAGVGGGSGFAYRSASQAYVADSTHYADSVAAHPPADSTSVDEHGDASATADANGADDASISHGEDVPATPADSLRAVAASRAAAANASHAPAKGAKSEAHAADASAGHEPAGTAPASARTAPVAEPKPSTAAVANVVREARNDAMSTPLPEQRLAKIFAAMSAKDAAKVLDQMADNDIREILSLMNDRAAAAILVQFAPARAAAITKGAGKTVNKEPGQVP